mmetsp:Transcript_71054/g.107460  ORF Transcript_71054/g.107460 Transcript_71054/m.107460 type:complete len:108 (+) Transcript_71054:210-533(+)
MVCLNYGSVCEIKTVKDIQKMTKNFGRGALDGGNSYDAFYAVRKELSVSTNQYIAIQSKQLGRNTSWPVHVAEVHDVTEAKALSHESVSAQGVLQNPLHAWYEQALA